MRGGRDADFFCARLGTTFLLTVGRQSDIGRADANRVCGKVEIATELKEAAEKVESVTSATKVAHENKVFTAALKALRHPKSDFFRNLLKPKMNSKILFAALKRCATQNQIFPSL